MKKFFIVTMILGLIINVLLCTTLFAGPNINAGIEFDLDATTPGNQNVYHINTQPSGVYIRVDVYATGVHNLDTYEIEILYDASELDYISCSATNPLTFEENILTSEGGTAIGWMVDDSNLGILSIAYTLAGTDTLEAPEGEGLIADIVFQTQATTTSTLEFGTIHYFNSAGVRDDIVNKGKAILFDCGFITGTITDESTGDPVENSIITAASDSYTYQGTSDATGLYLLDMVLPDTYDITYYAFGYSEDTLSNIIVSNPDTNYIDVSLLHPEIELSISELEISLPLNTIYDTTMTIGNIGNGYLDYTVSVVDLPELILNKPKSAKYSAGNTITDFTQKGFSNFSSIIKPDYNPNEAFNQIKSTVDTVHYDGEPYGSIGLVTGGEFEAAIRLTPDELSAYHGFYVVGVLFYYGTGTEIGLVNIYDEGTSSTPGALLTSQGYVATEESWCYSELFTPIRIESTKEMWVGVSCAHVPDEYPMEHDEGPAVPFKSDWSKNNGLWDEMRNFNMNYSWNIRVIVSPLPCNWLATNPSYGRVQPTESQDISLLLNTFALQDSTYECFIVIENNSSENLISIPVTLHAGNISVDDKPHAGNFVLQQNHPNPISMRNNQNTSTTISYSLPCADKVSLNIYNLRGQLVEKLIDDEQLPGIHTIEWSPKDITSGIYLYRLVAGNHTATKKILILQ